MKVSAAARRLLPEVSDLALTEPAHEAFLIARLLQAGDSADLRDLFAQHPESRVCQVFEQRGSRQIDRRSRAFWSLVLATDPPSDEAAMEDLWTL